MQEFCINSWQNTTRFMPVTVQISVKKENSFNYFFWQSTVVEITETEYQLNVFLLSYGFKLTFLSHRYPIMICIFVLYYSVEKGKLVGWSLNFDILWITVLCHKKGDLFGYWHCPVKLLKILYLSVWASYFVHLSVSFSSIFCLHQ